MAAATAAAAKKKAGAACATKYTGTKKRRDQIGEKKGGDTLAQRATDTRSKAMERLMQMWRARRASPMIVLPCLSPRDRAASALTATAVAAYMLAGLAGALATAAAIWLVPLLCLAAYARMPGASPCAARARRDLAAGAASWFGPLGYVAADRAAALVSRIPPAADAAMTAIGLDGAVHLLGRLVAWVAPDAAVPRLAPTGATGQTSADEDQ